MQIKTGQVFQRTTQGPNYLCLGKARVDGVMKVIATKNGNVKRNGEGKRPNLGALKLHAFDPEKVARIHQVRPVNVKNVIDLSSAPQVKATRMVKKGLHTEAELPNANELV